MPMERMGLKAIKAIAAAWLLFKTRETAQVGVMPGAALEATAVDYMVDLQEIPPLLLRIGTMQEETYGATG